MGTGGRNHRFIITGFVLVFALFAVVLYHESTTSSLDVTGYVILEDGVRVSTQKMDSSLVTEIRGGDVTPKVVVVLDESASVNTDGVGGGKSQQEFIDQLKQNIVVSDSSSARSGVEDVKKISSSGSSGVDGSSDFALTHTFSSVSAIAGEVTSADGLVELTKNKHVRKILLDYPVSVNLDKSALHINAPRVWNVTLNGSSVDGRGGAVCIIDTGVDYAHAALGGCSAATMQLNGAVEMLSVPVESSHPYSDTMDQTWVIQREGFEHMALHFSKIELEQISSAGDTTDRVYVYDSQNRTVAVYKGISNDMWTPSVLGDMMYVRLVSDGSVSGYGFSVDSIINGTTNVTMDWSGCSKVVGGYDVYNNDANPQDDHGHGTHVAGIIGSTDLTYRGIAPGANIVALKAMSGSGSGYSSDVLAAMEWCTKNKEKFGISVISMSLGCDGGSCPHYQTYCSDDILASAVAGAIAKNISVVVAAGNSGWVDGISSPACINGVIPVGGVNSADEILFNRGKLLRLLAPAQGITSAKLAGGFVALSGTSMATPHVAGAILLLQDYAKRVYGRELTSAEVNVKLIESGKKVYDSRVGLNFSRIDVFAAIGGAEGLSGVNKNVSNSSAVILNETERIGDLSLIVLPVNNSYVSTLLNVSVAARSNVSLYGVWYSVSGDNGSVLLNNSMVWDVSGATSSVENYTLFDSVVVSGWREGSYTLASYVIDREGKEVFVFSTFNVDRTFPRVGNVDYMPVLLYTNTSALFTVIVNESSIDSTLVKLWYTVNGSDWQSGVMSKDMSGRTWGSGAGSEVYTYSLNLTQFAPNSVLQFYVSGSDLAGNVNTSAMGNVTIYEGVNAVVVPPVNAGAAVLTITSPLNGSVVEVGSVISYTGVVENLNVSRVFWNFSSGGSDTVLSGVTQFIDNSVGYNTFCTELSNKTILNSCYISNRIVYNKTGIVVMQVWVNATEGQFAVNTTVVVNDTTAPKIEMMSFAKEIHLGKVKSQQVNVSVFDYSGISALTLGLNGVLENGVCSKESSRWSCGWNMSNLSLGNATLMLTVADGASVVHTNLTNYTFVVQSCSDFIQNGDEAGVDCDGSCGACNGSVSSANVSAVIEATPVAAAVADVAQSTPVVVAAPVDSTVVNKAEGVVPVQTASVKNQEVGQSADKKEVASASVVQATDESQKEGVLYVLGLLVVVLSGLYVFMMREGL